MSDEVVRRLTRELEAEGVDVDARLANQRVYELRAELSRLRWRIAQQDRDIQDRGPPLPEEIGDSLERMEFKPTIKPWTYARYAHPNEWYRCMHYPKFIPSLSQDISTQSVQVYELQLRPAYTDRHGYWLFGQCLSCLRIYWTVTR